MSRNITKYVFEWLFVLQDSEKIMDLLKPSSRGPPMRCTTSMCGTASISSFFLRTYTY